MKRNISVWQILGFGFVSLFGSLLHFLYDWTSQSLLVAPFSATNESTWEHMKLLFFSFFIFAVIESFFFKEYKNFWCIKLIGIIVGLTLIPVLFYTYNGALGRSPDWVNISIFFVSAAISFILETRLFKSGALRCKNPRFCLFLICIIGLLFIVFTFAVPKLPIFKDPITDEYGIIS